MSREQRDEAVAFLKRTRLKAFHVLSAPFAPIGRRLMWTTSLPSLPRVFRFRHNPPHGAWPPFEGEVPRSLRGVVGIRRRPEEEQAAFEAGPLPDWNTRFPIANGWFERDLWRTLLMTYPRLMRIIKAADRSPDLVNRDARGARELSEQERRALTQAMKAHAARVGLSAVGVAPYDPKYTVVGEESHVGTKLTEAQLRGFSVIVCVLEQQYEATQTLPSIRAEKAAITAYSDLMLLSEKVAEDLRARGYQARAYAPEGPAIVIHYGVEAGLGQLGHNGQLLTPQAGSRCRINLIVTDAPLVPDGPRDYGINKLCDECRVCIRRCPGNALTPVRRFHRGVEKAKLNTERCLPVMVVANACAICMKVCPVQRFGLAAVHAHYEATGEILGKGTDDLEGFNWPLDGRRYGPGERPQLPRGHFERPETIELRNYRQNAGR
jgi:epoxyqueuosine reductase